MSTHQINLGHLSQVLTLEGLQKLALTTLTAGIVYIVTLSFYRLYLHPLSSYPGPTIAKLTDWHNVYHAYLGDKHLVLQALHAKYGPVVRSGPNALSFNSAEALKDIYGHSKNFRKSDFYLAFVAVKGAHNTHNAISKPENARKRRVLSHAFSESALKSMEGLMLNNIRTFCEQMENLPGAKDMAQWMNYLSFDIMGELCFGKSFGMLKDESTRFVTRLIDKAAHKHYISGNYPMMDTLKLDKVLFPTIATDRWQYIMYSRAQATERMKLGVDYKKDFFSHLIGAKDAETGEGFTTPELWGEANLLMIAGSDTTSTGLASTMYYLVKNPQCLARAVKEVRSAFTSEEDIVSGQAVTNLTYLRACIDEALRMAPPVPGGLPRAAMAGGAKVCGQLLPEGTVVGVPCYTIHHNEKYFPQPFTFRPERWIEDTPEQMELARKAWAPFSIGPRACIGKSMAMMELRLTLARVLWMFDVSAQGKLPEEYAIEDHFTCQKEGPMINFERRSAAPA